jgi:hypothetical protein
MKVLEMGLMNIKYALLRSAVDDLAARNRLDGHAKYCAVVFRMPFG